MKLSVLIISLCLLSYGRLISQDWPVNYFDENENIKVLIVKDPYTDSRTGPEKLKGPDNLDNIGFREVLDQMDCRIVKTVTINMPEELDNQYGEWNRASLTNHVLNKAIADYEQSELFVLGLLSGNKSLIGMLAGLQHMGPNRNPLKDSRNRDIVGLPRLGENKPLKVGLIWLNSKASFNTPDITLEGDMGGMNVAVAAGLCSSSLRLQAGLDPPVSSKHIVMVGAWDTNPYEEHAIDNSFISMLSVEEVKKDNNCILEEVKRLSQLVDLIYVHVDVSTFDSLSSAELYDSMKEIFSYPKAAALGIASCPENPDDQILNDVNLLIKGALEGVRNR